jgi:hypothetical protein
MRRAAIAAALLPAILLASSVHAAPQGVWAIDAEVLRLIAIDCDRGRPICM